MSLPLGEFIAVWGLLAVNITSPGPNVLNTIATAMDSGLTAGLGSAAGVGVGIGLWCIGMSLGAAAVFAWFPDARLVLTLVSSGLLLWISSRYLRTAVLGLLGRATFGQAGASHLSVAASFRRSLLVNATNPQALATWTAILGMFPVARATALDLATLWAGTVAIAVTIHAGYAALFSSPAAARLYSRWSWALAGAAGVFFLTFALKLVWQAVRTGT